MALGAAVYTPMLNNITNIKTFNNCLESAGKDIVFYKDGITSTVTVHKNKDKDGIFLRVNGKTDASYYSKPNGDMRTQWLLGFLPVSIHQNPERVCVIGFGSGITAGAVNQSSKVKTIDTVEIEPAVMDAEKFFTEGNFNVTRSPKFKLHIADGRNFILASKDKYDVIISEPSNPWIAGIGNLFSKNLYQIAYDKLNEDGIYCQWLQLYSTNPETLQMIINTFYSVFPYGSIWMSDCTDIMLIGSKKEIPIDNKLLESSFNQNEKIKRYMTDIGFTQPYQLAAHHVLDSNGIRAYIQGGKLNTDDLPLLEFEAPMHLYLLNNTKELVSILFRFHDNSLNNFINIDSTTMNKVDFYEDLSRSAVSLGINTQAIEFLNKAIEKDPRNYKSILALAKLQKDNGDLLKSSFTLQDAINIEPTKTEAYLRLIELYNETGRLDKCKEIIEKAIKNAPQESVLIENKLVLDIYLKNYQEALLINTKLLKHEPENTRYLNYMGKIYFEMGKYKEASQWYEKTLKKDSFNFKALTGMGDICKNKEQWIEAVKFYEKAKEVKPDDENISLKLAYAYEKAEMAKNAESIYRELIFKDYYNPKARSGLLHKSLSE
jgi:spermidine synthase